MLAMVLQGEDATSSIRAMKYDVAAVTLNGVVLPLEMFPSNDQMCSREELMRDLLETLNALESRACTRTIIICLLTAVYNFMLNSIFVGFPFVEWTGKSEKLKDTINLEWFIRSFRPPVSITF